LDWEDWRAFQLSLCEDIDNRKGRVGSKKGRPPSSVMTSQKARKRIPHTTLLLVIPLILLVTILMAALPGKRAVTNTKYDPQNFSFKSRPVAEGLPNSVIFEYDASAAQPDARVEIQQNWDARRRKEVAVTGNIASSIYYEPGFYQAKLLVDDQIVQEHDVFIPSEEWVGLAYEKDNEVPNYFSEEELRKDDRLGISTTELEKKNLLPRESGISIQHVADYGSITVDDFTLTTHLRSDFSEGVAKCQRAEIILLCSGEAIIIPFSIKGCVAEMRVWMLDYGIFGSNNDLSAFGVDWADWVKLQLKAQDGHMAIYINDQLARELVIPEGRKNKIVGIRYEFQGTGSVRDLVLEGREGEHLRF
ncbi:MAG: hypothetical protein AAFU67_17325, partial [Bacteroidota bacterium]